VSAWSLHEKTRLWPGFSLPANRHGRGIMDMTLGEPMKQATKNRPKAVF
jgi:hypothetical protein